MSGLDAARLAIDLGLVVLIWLVQLVVYPSFARIDAGTFTAWHRRYRERVSFVVVPLMIGQVAVVGMQWVRGVDVWIVGAAGLVLCLWLLTFLVSVPAHAALQVDGNRPDRVRRLVVTNWWRTVAWTLVFLTGAARLA